MGLRPNVQTQEFESYRKLGLFSVTSVLVSFTLLVGFFQLLLDLALQGRLGRDSQALNSTHYQRHHLQSTSVCALALLIIVFRIAEGGFLFGLNFI